MVRAHAAAEAKNYNEAAGICTDILEASPDHAPALALMGAVAAHLKDPERGIPLLERAIALRPDVANWHVNLSTLYHMALRFDDAIRAGREGIRLEPNDATNLVNLSLVLTDMDQHENAVACLIRALGLNPDHADGHLALAENLLALGDYGAGLKEYEWRNKTPGGHPIPTVTSAPWNGMRLPKGKILLVGDQGYGDTIQFARYIPMVAERCQEVLLGASQELHPILCGMPTTLYNRWAAVPPHAVHCRLSSLPYLLGTTLGTIPGKVPYVFADPKKAAAWNGRLPNAPRVGLAWTGRPTHPNDKRRSMSLETLLPLSGYANFVSLQKPLSERDEWLMSSFGMTDLSPCLNDFGDTAALIANLDLVITVDTAIAHLAGAMGKPVWIMLAKAADWRWLLNRRDSPWYPSAKLFRQDKPGEWGPVVESVKKALGDTNTIHLS